MIWLRASLVCLRLIKTRTSRQQQWTSFHFLSHMLQMPTAAGLRTNVQRRFSPYRSASSECFWGLCQRFLLNYVFVLSGAERCYDDQAQKLMSVSHRRRTANPDTCCFYMHTSFICTYMFCHSCIWRLMTATAAACHILYIMSYNYIIYILILLA